MRLLNKLLLRYLVVRLLLLLNMLLLRFLVVRLLLLVLQLLNMLLLRLLVVRLLQKIGKELMKKCEVHISVDRVFAGFIISTKANIQQSIK